MLSAITSVSNSTPEIPYSAPAQMTAGGGAENAATAAEVPAAARTGESYDEAERKSAEVGAQVMNALLPSLTHSTPDSTPAPDSAPAGGFAESAVNAAASIQGADNASARSTWYRYADLSALDSSSTPSDSDTGTTGDRTSRRHWTCPLTSSRAGTSFQG